MRVDHEADVGAGEPAGGHFVGDERFVDQAARDTARVLANLTDAFSDFALLWAGSA